MTRKTFEDMKELGTILYDFDMSENIIEVKGIDFKKEGKLFCAINRAESDENLENESSEEEKKSK
jgi:hypothetical protein